MKKKETIYGATVEEIQLIFIILVMIMIMQK